MKAFVVNRGAPFPLATMIITLVWMIGSGFAVHLFGQKVSYAYPETIRLVALVDDAASTVSQRGEKAFTDFMRDGTKWRYGERYTFAIDLDGNILAHEDTSLVGKNMIDLKDPNGKPIIQWFIRKGLGFTQSGWTHYLWVKPGDTVPSWKTTYVKLAKAPSGKIYVVGSGLYDMRMEKAFAIDAVNDATYLIRVEGTQAFDKLRDPTSEFVFKDTYIFVLDTSYNLLVNQPFRELEGKNLYDIQDTTGKYFFREFVQVAEEDGSGWVFYKWPKPDQIKPANKCSFVKKIVSKGNTYVVGTGIYQD
ncbi:MAG: cache domain-containing protein [Bacteroidales bacterium]|nr:cache domain-containing protein [Bacteroidales bacterium]